MPSKTRIHVRPDPNSSGWLMMHQTDQQAFEYDREYHGESTALLNLQNVQRVRDHLRPIIEKLEG